MAASPAPIIPEPTPRRRDPEFQHTPPRRLSVDASSPYYHECFKRVGVKLDGRARQGDVREYDVDEGWIIVFKRDRRGRPIANRFGDFETMLLRGTVEPFWRGTPADPRAAESLQEIGTEDRVKAAAEKRARKALKLARQMRA